MSLLIISPAKSHQMAEKMVWSAHKHNLNVMVYVDNPMGSPHGGDIQGTRPIEIMKTKGESHIMCVDAPDVFFQDGEQRIMEVFRSFDSPFVISAECWCGVPVCNAPERMSAFPGKYKYINCGCWLGERMYAIDLMQKAIDLYRNKPWDPNYNLDSPCAWFTYGYLEGTLSFALDRDAQLFFNTAAPAREDVEVRDGKVWNSATGMCPPVIHYNGTASSSEPYKPYYDMMKQLYGI